MGGAFVRMTVGLPQRLRAFTAILALAIVLGARASAAPLPPADLPPEFAVGTVAADTSGGYARIVVTFDRPTQVTASIVGRVLTVKSTKPIDADLVGLTQRLGNYVSSVRREPDRLMYRFALAVPLRLQTSVLNGRTAIDLVPETFAGSPPPLSEATASAGPRVASAPPVIMTPAVPEATAIDAAAGRAPTATPEGNGAVLRFPEARGHSVAVFTRGETLWIVLDGHPTLDSATLFANIASIVTKAEADEVEGATVLRLRFISPLVATVSEDNTALNVTLAPTGDAALAVKFAPAGVNGMPALTAALPGAARTISISDPDAGDRMLVVPGRPGNGVLTPRRYVELEALPSTAGVAIVPYADDLSVGVVNGVVEFSRPEGLSLSVSLTRAAGSTSPL